ncbi:MAG: hypothetical protein D6719_12540 [Candidatus Dadabacteria bacterium]|nr:MAG: hypothetical protein D6719_12540 [Candidatus Dadabacteria bacterium]
MQIILVVILTLFPFVTPLSAKAQNSTQSPADFLDTVLTEQDIAVAFGLKNPTEGIDRVRMISFLTNQVGIVSYDAEKTAYFRWGDKQPPYHGSFVPTKERSFLLEKAGINYDSTKGGMSPAQYLQYLAIAFGPDMGKSPATVRDFMVSMLVNLNGIYNIRELSLSDSVDDNKYSVHRESLADHQVIDYVARTFLTGEPNGVDPLRSFVLRKDLHGKFMLKVLGSGDNLEQFLIHNVNLNPALAGMVKNFMIGKIESYQDPAGIRDYYYGLWPFLNGLTCSRTRPGHCYSADMDFVNQILSERPDFDLAGELNVDDIYSLVNTLGSFPFTSLHDAAAFKPPYNDVSPELTGADWMEFFIGLGNALFNGPSGLFNDALPQSDIDAVISEGIDNGEFEFNRLVIPYMYQQLLRLAYPDKVTSTKSKLPVVMR